MSSERALILLSHLTDNAIRHNDKTVQLRPAEEGHGGSIQLLPTEKGVVFESQFPAV